MLLSRLSCTPTWDQCHRRVEPTEAPLVSFKILAKPDGELQGMCPAVSLTSSFTHANPSKLGKGTGVCLFLQWFLPQTVSLAACAWVSPPFPRAREGSITHYQCEVRAMQIKHLHDIKMKTLDPDEAPGVFSVLQGILPTVLLRFTVHALKSSVPDYMMSILAQRKIPSSRLVLPESDFDADTHIRPSMLHRSSHPFPPPSHKLAVHQAASASS